MLRQDKHTCMHAYIHMYTYTFYRRLPCRVLSRKTPKMLRAKIYIHACMYTYIHRRLPCCVLSRKTPKMLRAKIYIHVRMHSYTCIHTHFIGACHVACSPEKRPKCCAPSYTYIYAYIHTCMYTYIHRRLPCRVLSRKTPKMLRAKILDRSNLRARILRANISA